MAKTYPLAPITASKYVGKSPMAVTDQSEQYKSMLGTQAASEDVGLFYQLNSVASDATDNAAVLGQTAGGLTPVEANAQYT